VACVYAALDHDGRIQLLEMPGWMFDRATCAAMPLADHPFVGIKRLQALFEPIGQGCRFRIDPAAGKFSINSDKNIAP
jgi:hypothetical protein